MKVRIWAVPASLALLLTACVAPAPQDDGHRHHHHQRHENSMQDPGNEPAPRHERRGERRAHGAERFSCENGLSVTVRQQGTDRVSLQLDDKSAVLNRATSGSGERYTSNRGLFGSGAEWHRKGNEAAFSFKDPYGNHVETACQRQQ